MGRRAQGYKLLKRGRVYTVRFTVDGKRHEYSTGESTRTEAERVAKPLYSEALRGRLEPKRRGPTGVGRDLRELLDLWMADHPIRPTTRVLYGKYCKKWETHFRNTARLNDRDIASYCRLRLREVRGKTAGSEMAALRAFCSWAVDLGHMASMPQVPTVKKSIAGTPYKHRRRVKAPELSPEEIEEILQHLPETSSRQGFVVRDRFIVAYDTTLRPETLTRIRCPENWSPGDDEISLTAEDDKELYGRVIPLTERAQKAMESAWKLGGQSSGPIFGYHRFEHYLRAAAAKVLPPSKANVFTGQHFRSAALTHYLEATGNLPGLMAMAGHKHASTTSKYIRPTLRAARQMLKDASDKSVKISVKKGKE